MKTFNNQKVVHRGMCIFLMTIIPNPDPREPSPDLSKLNKDTFTDQHGRTADPNEDNKNPNTDISGIKDDRTHDPDDAQSEQEEKDDDKPDLSGNINV
ncbi:hypothetical protein [Sphingobacterium sp. HMA12]|uniref:hypothetical protein n=1 Tax=Sphingobacterium sp. HMA12 TaxID=2050894 RepID=UPI000CEA3A46|nr:hypothetical protein [Sphingobacterium sp. HMA12]